MNYLWNFYIDCGRSGSIEGLFVATEEEVENLIGKRIYIDEPLGKHSEVSGTIEKHEITKLELDSETVDKVSRILGSTWSGFNPFDYVREEVENE